MGEAFRGRKRVEAPEGWPALFDRLVRSADLGVRKDAAALALAFGDPRGAAFFRATMDDPTASAPERRDALQALAERRVPGLSTRLRDLLDDPTVRGAALRALAAYDDPATPDAVLRAYPTLTGPDRDDAINTLASRPAFARALVDAVDRGAVKARDIPVTVARQIQGFGDRGLSAKLEAVWGTLRPTSRAKAALLARYKALLTPDRLARADLTRGRAVFRATCAPCHKLFGDGGDLGPELTGSDRANPDYVLQNVLDPSATVGRDYLLTTVATRDGRILSGLLRAQTDRTLTVQTVNERVTLDRDDVEEVKTSEASVMPEGLFEKLTDDEVRDLVAYLASSK
jgi:putative heme-binding domain-containing protein